MNMYCAEIAIIIFIFNILANCLPDCLIWFGNLRRSRTQLLIKLGFCQLYSVHTILYYITLGQLMYRVDGLYLSTVRSLRISGQNYWTRCKFFLSCIAEYSSICTKCSMYVKYNNHWWLRAPSRFIGCILFRAFEESIAWWRCILTISWSNYKLVNLRLFSVHTNDNH
jgi:hypothetical protein